MGIVDTVRRSARESDFKKRFPQINAVASFALGRAKHFVMWRLIRMTGCTVAEGPFKGMKYIKEATGSSFMPKLVGCYECELHNSLMGVFATPYKDIVNIGCAEGYYAVGMALRMPQACIHAFDTGKRAQRLCSQLAALNGVQERVHVGGFCDAEVLEKTISGKALVICDCEGYEKVLMDPAQSPSLKYADIIVELHDFIDPAISSTIISRFQRTHAITLIDSGKPRTASEFPMLSNIWTEFHQVTTDEMRPGIMQWACMVARS